jgi:hypothetical protein
VVYGVLQFSFTEIGADDSGTGDVWRRGVELLIEFECGFVVAPGEGFFSIGWRIVVDDTADAGLGSL